MKLPTKLSIAVGFIALLAVLYCFALGGRYRVQDKIVLLDTWTGSVFRMYSDGWRASPFSDKTSLEKE